LLEEGRSTLQTSLYHNYLLKTEVAKKEAYAGDIKEKSEKAATARCKGGGKYWGMSREKDPGKWLTRKGLEIGSDIWGNTFAAGGDTAILRFLTAGPTLRLGLKKRSRVSILSTKGREKRDTKGLELMASGG